MCHYKGQMNFQHLQLLSDIRYQFHNMAGNTIVSSWQIALSFWCQMNPCLPLRFNLPLNAMLQLPDDLFQ